MGIADLLLLAVTRPGEFRSLVHYKVWRDPLNDIKQNPEESGWNRQQMKDCWHFLDLTSRSFSAVIKELKGELARIVSFAPQPSPAAKTFFSLLTTLVGLFPSFFPLDLPLLPRASCAGHRRG